MDKTAIRNYAIEARKILMKSAIAEAGFYGISKDGVKVPIQKGKDFEVYETLAGTEKRIFGDDIKRRENLANAVKELGFEQVIEETAYTWFNRIIAIRFMEVNNYLPTRVRVLSSETGSSTPDIVTQADTVELNMSVAELESVRQAKQDNKYDEAFRLLFIKQCNELNAILPGLFEKTNDYMELLLKIPYTGDGVIRMLIDTIPEDNFNVDTEGQVEIIGWMYQYYNTELKDDTFAKLKKNVKITKERIPAATQLFTPDWIVRYMVENALGRVWIEHLRAVDPTIDEKAKAEEFGWKYYLSEAEQEADVASQLVEIRKSYRDLTPQDITCIDPCMGSGHILVYMFDVLMDIYRSEGFSEREAVFDILEKNIRGLDIDRRAYQLSYFALMMKARGYNRIFFRGRENIEGERVQAVPQVYAIEESNNINRNQLQYFGKNMPDIERNCALNELTGLLDKLVDAKEYGSILNMDNYNWDLIVKYMNNLDISGQMNWEMVGIDETKKKVDKLVFVARTLAGKYDAVITNPPYMAISSAGPKLNNYINKYYVGGKTDLFSVFIERCMSMTCSLGYTAMITMQSWMFLTSFSKIREKVLAHEIINMAHLGARGFDEISGEVVQTVAFVVGNVNLKSCYKGQFCRLIDGKSEKEKAEAFLSKKNVYLCDGKKIGKIPQKLMAYWVSDSIIDCFDGDSLEKIIVTREGMATADNERFLRLWYEVSSDDISFNCSSEQDAIKKDVKWVPYNKGGASRKWYGNNDYVVNWANDGYEIRNNKDPKTGRIRSHNYNGEYGFREGVTWSAISSDDLAVRYTKQGFLFDSKGAKGFARDKKTALWVLGLLNSKIAMQFLQFMSPTLDFKVGDIINIPYRSLESKIDSIVEIVEELVAISKEEWDSFETSWDFKIHPLLKYKKNLVEESYNCWKEERQKAIKRSLDLENQLNKEYAYIYGLEDTINYDISEEDISLRKADLERDIKSLVSYAVGCVLGRYSTKKEGLLYANGNRKFDCEDDFIDKDGIIPITDEQYHEDDIVKYFESFIANIFGTETLEINLEFVANSLGTKGNTSREKIRNYFLNEFYKDHINTYSVTGSGKRPIYWMFDSGKENGFKCLVYMHRYSQDLVGIIRSDYLVSQQSAIENALKNMEYILQSSTSVTDKAQATKKRDKYIKQLAEIKSYYQALSHVALQRVELDLDAGVKTNYSKFQGVEITNEGEKKQTIDLLAKI